MLVKGATDVRGNYSTGQLGMPLQDNFLPVPQDPRNNHRAPIINSVHVLLRPIINHLLTKHMRVHVETLSNANIFYLHKRNIRQYNSV